MSTKRPITAEELKPLIGRRVEIWTRKNVYCGILVAVEPGATPEASRVVIGARGCGYRKQRRGKILEGTFVSRLQVTPAFNQVLAVKAYDDDCDMMSLKKVWP